MRELRGDWRDLFHAFRMALDLRKMSLAFVGMVANFLLVSFILILSLVAFQKRDVSPERPGGRATLWREFKAGEWDRVSHRVQAFANATFRHREVALRCPARCAEPCARPCTLPLPSKAGAALYVLCGLASLLVWSFFGGAITRIAAVELAKDERIEFAEATRFARAHYGSYLWSPLSVAAAVLLFSLSILGVAWVADATWGWVFGKVLLVLGLPLALLGGFLILLLLMGGVLGFGLMFPAVSAEGTDAFDAVSRAFSYVFSRPCRWLGYHAVALAYAVPSCLFVIVCTVAFIRITLCLGQMGMPHGHFQAIAATLPPALGGSLDALPASAGPGERTVACLVSGMLYVLIGLALAYTRSYLWTSLTVIYFLLRKAVDGTEMKEVYEEESEEDLVAGGAGGTGGGSPAPAPQA